MNTGTKVNYLNLVFITIFFLQLSCKDNSTDPGNDIPGYQNDIDWPSMNNIWSAHHGDAQFTGRSRYTGPQSGQIEWKIQMPGMELARNGILSPVIGSDSTVYIISLDTASHLSYLYSVSFNGSINWKFPIASREITSPPLISSSGTVYVADWERNLYAVNLNGTLKWKIVLPSEIKGVMNLDKEGCLYALAISGQLFKVSPAGDIQWTLNLEGVNLPSSAVVFSPGGEVMYVTGKKVYAVSILGEILWSNNYDPGSVPREGTPMVDSDGNIYVNYGRISYFPNGSLRYTLSDPYYIDPAIDKMGNIYIGTETHIISYDYRLEERWSKRYALYTLFGIVCDSEGMIYFLIKDNILVKVDSGGNEKWRLPLDARYINSPALANGRIYIGAGIGPGKYFYSIK